MASTKTATSPFTSSFSTAQRIPTNTFDTILPPTKMSTWEQEDAKMKPKRSSKEIAAKAKSKVGHTVKSAWTKAEELKKVVDKNRAKGETDKEIRKADKANQKAIKDQRKLGRR